MTKQSYVPNTPVLVTNGSSRTSYSALRSLSKMGVNCISADVSRLGMCQFSRLSKGHYLYSSHYEDEEIFVAQLLDLIKRNNVSLLFPSHNETEIIARHRHRFDSNVVSIIPDKSHCHVFNNKSLAYDLAEKLGVPVPRRIRYTNPNQIDSLLMSQCIDKTVIKLLTGNSGKGVFYGDSPAHTKRVVEDLIVEFDLQPDRYPQVEEYVQGEGYGNSVLFWQGQHIVNFTHRRLRDKIETGGTSTFREASRHQGIEAAALKIFKSIGWHGLAMCEFKVCPETGEFWFIEVNPRMWGSISLAIESGVEFPYLAWLCASKGPEAAVSHHSNSKIASKWTARWLLGDIFLVLGYLSKLNFKAVRDILVEGKADSIDDFFWDDPFVFFGEAFAYLKTAISNRSINASEKGMIG